uniref:Secreted protein n=1 Tax=Trichogramma kaykai TaxID=54128 RepID=A0ABD2W2X9_9HYME
MNASHLKYFITERTQRPRSAALGCAKRTVVVVVVVVVVGQCVSRGERTATARLLLLRPVLPRATWYRSPRRNVIADSEAKIVAGQQRLYPLLSHRPVPGSRLQDRLYKYSSLTAALSRVHAR